MLASAYRDCARFVQKLHLLVSFQEPLSGGIRDLAIYFLAYDDFWSGQKIHCASSL